jgi:chorismate lyase/3-hydroxybenzoate synthase
LPVDYVAEPASNSDVIGVAPLPMRQLGPETLQEVWSGELFFGTYESGDDEDIERAARTAYDEILRTTRERGNPCLLRIWNHIRDINEGEGDAERYRRFCAGRHDAFDAAQWPNDMLPAASAVGIRQRRLVISYLAARTPGRQIENPRQVSAYPSPST